MPASRSVTSARGFRAADEEYCLRKNMRMDVKRTGRVGVPFNRRIYSGSWTADDRTLTVSWHHIEKTVPLESHKADPAKLARDLLNEIIETVNPRGERPRG